MYLNASVKRELSQTRLSYAGREKRRMYRNVSVKREQRPNRVWGFAEHEKRLMKMKVWIDFEEKHQ